MATLNQLAEMDVRLETPLPVIESADFLDIGALLSDFIVALAHDALATLGKQARLHLMMATEFAL